MKLYVNQGKEVVSENGIKIPNSKRITSVDELERAMRIGEILGVHIGQGHIEQTVTLIDMLKDKCRWVYTFRYTNNYGNITI